VDGIADGLLVATEIPGDPGDVVAARTGGDNLTAAEREGIRGAQAQFHRVALDIRQRTRQQRRLHRPSLPNARPPVLMLH
jgi:uncharacterized membrane protein